MNKILGAAMLLFSTALLHSCFTPPDFAATPRIEFNKVEFQEIGGLTDPDLLIIDIGFRDGDGDIGLSPEAIDSPFHATNFFAGLNGQLTTLSSKLKDLSDYTYESNHQSPHNISYVVGYIPKNAGKLVTASYTNNPMYNSLPPFNPPYSTCTANLRAYLNDTIFVKEDFLYALEPSSVVDQLVNANNHVVYYAVLNKWYIEANEGNHNIFVKFEVKNSTDNEFHEFDWRKEYCTTFDGRIPPFVESEHAIEGSLRYTMPSTGFRTLFGLSTLRLSVQVMDRNFNKSNLITSPEFVLNN